MPRLEGLAFHKPIVLTEHTSGTRLVARIVAGDVTVRSCRLSSSGGCACPPGGPRSPSSARATEAYYFAGLILAKDRSLVDLYVVPTTAGVATIACVGSRGLVAPHYDCWRNAATLHVRGGRPLRLGPDAAFRQRLPGALSALEHARQQARAELATQVPAQQAAAASRLGGHVSVASSLTRAAGAARRGPGRERSCGNWPARPAPIEGSRPPCETRTRPRFRKGEDAVHARERRIKQLLNPPADE